MNRRVLLGSAGTALAQALLLRAQAPPGPAVFEHDLPSVNMNNWAVHVSEINYKPGDASAPHRHPGITLVYVLEGEIESQVGDGPVRTYGPGQMFMETPNQLHGVSRNASKTRPAKFIAILMAEKGKPLLAPA